MTGLAKVITKRDFKQGNSNRHISSLWRFNIWGYFFSIHCYTINPAGRDKINAFWSDFHLSINVLE